MVRLVLTLTLVLLTPLQSFSVLGKVDVPVSRIAVSGQTAYAVSGGCEPGYPRQCESTLTTVDVSDPSAPVVLGQYVFDQENILDFAVSGGFAYFIAWNGESSELPLVVLDVSDPTQPHEVARLDRAALTLGQIKIQGDYAYVGAGADGIRILDVATPTSPVELAHLPRSRYGDFTTSIDVVGDRLYVARAGGLYIYDVETPSNPQELNVVGIDDIQEVRVTPDNRMAYVYTASMGSDPRNGGAYPDTYLTAIDVSDPTQPRTRWFQQGVRVADMAVADTSLLVAEGKSLGLWQWTDSAHMTKTAQLANLPDFVWDVEYQEGLGFLSLNTQLLIVRLPAPAHVRLPLILR